MDKNLENLILSLTAGVYNLPAGTIDGLNVESLTKLFKPTDHHELIIKLSDTDLSDLNNLIIPDIPKVQELSKLIYENKIILDKYNQEINSPKLIDSLSDPLNINSGQAPEDIPHPPNSNKKRFSSLEITQSFHIDKCEIMYQGILLGTIVENDPDVIIDMNSIETIKESINNTLMDHIKLIKGVETPLTGNVDIFEIVKDTDQLESLKSLLDESDLEIHMVISFQLPTVNEPQEPLPPAL